MRERASTIYHDTIGRRKTYSRSREALKRLSQLHDGVYGLDHCVYVSQTADANRGNIADLYSDIRDDEAAKRFGANSLEDFNYWAGRSCAIACVKMCIETFNTDDKRKLTLMDLVEETLSRGGYNTQTDVGWYHKPLVETLEKHHLKAKKQKYYPVEKIAEIIADDNAMVIASIKYNTKTGTQSHMVVIYGVELKNGKPVSFTLHNPDNSEDEGNGIIESVTDFAAVYRNNCIVVTKS